MTHSWSQYCTELTRPCQPLLPKFQVCMFSMRSQGLQSTIPWSMVFLATRLHIQVTQLVSCSKLVASWKACSKTWLHLGPLSRRSVVIYTFSCRIIMRSLSLAIWSQGFIRTSDPLDVFSSGLELPPGITCLLQASLGTWHLCVGFRGMVAAHLWPKCPEQP